MHISELDPSEYHSYYQPYIDALGKVSLYEALRRARADIDLMMDVIPDDKLGYSYSPGKWSMAEVLVHLMDAERVFQYRALRFARKDQTELKGFDQDIYVSESYANQRAKKALKEEFMAIRSSTITLFKSFDDEQLIRRGMANGAEMSVRALGFVICGHQAHHFGILKKRYLA